MSASIVPTEGNRPDRMAEFAALSGAISAEDADALRREVAAQRTIDQELWGGKSRRILFLSSSRRAWAECPDSADHFAAAPYSIDAISYNLEKCGWTVSGAGRKGDCNLFRLARHIDEFKIWKTTRTDFNLN